ncbi:MAG: hypothetical protein KBD29_02830 [Candidatus Magasanikbacteria bacterium]|nr:hypothetical protein [Candidatus Magasanikbacteria bacterium]
MGKNFWQRQVDRSLEGFNQIPSSKRYNEGEVRKALAGVQGLTEHEIDLVADALASEGRLDNYIRRKLGSDKVDRVRKAVADLKPLPQPEEHPFIVAIEEQILDVLNGIEGLTDQHRQMIVDDITEDPRGGGGGWPNGSTWQELSDAGVEAQVRKALERLPKDECSCYEDGEEYSGRNIE